MDIGKEFVHLRQRLEAVERQSRLKSASLDDATLVVRDVTGGLRAELGKQGDGTTAVNIVNGAPPPSPSTPTVSPALGGIAAAWDGLFADGAIIPMDWSRVEVHADPVDDFTPTTDTLKATIETAQGGIAYIPATVPLYVRLLARNTSGAASAPTDTVGPYAPRPVAGEIGIGEITETLIADGAVTTPKVFALAITTAKLDVGSVDAVALKADAITGKTITGGIINGAEFHSDDGAGGLVDIEAGTVTATAASGWKILMDPTQALPVIDFLDGEGDTAGSINATGDDARPALNVSSGPFADGAVSDYRWVTKMGLDDTSNGWTTARTRESDTTVLNGGYLYAGPDSAQFAYVDTDTPGDTTVLQVQPGVFIFDEGRLVLDPPASASTAAIVSAKTGHTGQLLRLQVDSNERFSVSATGDVAADGSISGASLAVTGNATANGDIEALGSLIGDNVRSGTATTASVPGGGTSSATVTFSTPMNGTPSVIITPSTAADPGTIVCRAYAENRTANGFTLKGYRSTASTTTWSWIAIST